DARRFRSVFLRQINTARAKAATDIGSPGARRDSRGLRQVLDELHLRGLFRFVATNPIAVMNVLSPQRMVIGAHAVVVLADFLFVIRPGHGAHRGTFPTFPPRSRGCPSVGFPIWEE